MSSAAGGERAIASVPGARTILLVLEAGLQVFPATAAVRAYQYEDLFHTDPRIRATFVSRRSPRYIRLTERLIQHVWGRQLARVLLGAEGPLVRRRERLIARMSRLHDCVYMLRTTSANLYELLWREGPARVVTDINDALWLPTFRNEGHAYDDLPDVIGRSRAVVCENGYLADYARGFSGNVHVVPDAPQLELFDDVRAGFRPPVDRVTLGWIGSSGTADNLCAIFEPLEEVFARHQNLHLRVLGARPRDLPRFEKVRFSCLPSYTHREMIQEALQMNAGLFPLFRTTDSVARGTLKARVYMSAALPVVATRWGLLPDLIEHGVNGFLPDSPAEWVACLERLVTQPAERDAIGLRALTTVRRQYTRRACFDRLVEALISAMEPDAVTGR
jgi:glycosyltransferase involved in cell wall biosynthesis